MHTITMVYCVMMTISLSSIIQTSFIIYLWSRLLYNDTKLITYDMPVATPSAPIYKED